MLLENIKQQVFSASHRDRLLAIECLAELLSSDKTATTAWELVWELSRTKDKQIRSLLVVWIFSPMTQESLSIENVLRVIHTLQDPHLFWICVTVYLEAPHTLHRHVSLIAMESDGEIFRNSSRTYTNSAGNVIDIGEIGAQEEDSRIE